MGAQLDKLVMEKSAVHKAARANFIAAVDKFALVARNSAPFVPNIMGIVQMHHDAKFARLMVNFATKQAHDLAKKEEKRAAFAASVAAPNEPNLENLITKQLQRLHLVPKKLAPKKVAPKKPAPKKPAPKKSAPKQEPARKSAVPKKPASAANNKHFH
jgi:hypothetical protein